MAVVLDTHAAIWYLSRSEQLSATALKKIEASVQAGESVFLSAISLVELIYLSEKGRLPAGALATLMNALQARTPAWLWFRLIPAVAAAVGRISRSAVPDMPDRVIAATAAHLGLPLITRDRQIQAAGINTVW